MMTSHEQASPTVMTTHGHTTHYHKRITLFYRSSHPLIECSNSHFLALILPLFAYTTMWYNLYLNIFLFFVKLFLNFFNLGYLCQIGSNGFYNRSSGLLPLISYAYIIREHDAPPACLHFTAPTEARLPFANSSVDKPAEMACIEFPRRATPTYLPRAVPYIPAGSDPLRLLLL
jgi:hypothetical protein